MKKMTSKKSEYLQTVFDYCNDITTRKILACEMVKKSDKRFLDDYKRQKEDGFLYMFSDDSFCEVATFAESLSLPDIKQNLKLQPWQLFIYANIWGWRLKSDIQCRRFRQAYIEVAR